MKSVGRHNRRGGGAVGGIKGDVRREMACEIFDRGAREFRDRTKAHLQ